MIIIEIVGNSSSKIMRPITLLVFLWVKDFVDVKRILIFYLSQRAKVPINMVESLKYKLQLKRYVDKIFGDNMQTKILNIIRSLGSVW